MKVFQAQGHEPIYGWKQSQQVLLHSYSVSHYNIDSKTIALVNIKIRTPQTKLESIHDVFEFCNH